MKLYPFDLPPGAHPMVWTLLGFGLQPDQVNALARHLYDDLGVRLHEGRDEETFSWAVGVDARDRERVEVGDEVDVIVSDRGAVRISGGALPPGVRLEKHSGKLVGTFTHPGLYSVTIQVGPAVKYDPLGSPGGPLDPGIWIPVDQPRQEPETNLQKIPLSIAELSDREKDHALAELMAWADGVTIKEADRGN